jgi:putative hydrolase of the HAD superfamily
MIKAILFDVDGVILYPRDKYFSQRLKEDGYSINEEEVRDFFHNQYKQIVIGKADLRDELEKVIEDWGWLGSVDELLEYWFSYENKINQEVVIFTQEIRRKGIKCYMASDHSKYREVDLLNNIGLAKDFDGAFFSASLGYTKEEREYFDKVVEMLRLTPEEIMFIDDDPKNVEIASQVLPNSILFTSVEKLKESVNV